MPGLLQVCAGRAHAVDAAAAGSSTNCRAAMPPGRPRHWNAAATRHSTRRLSARKAPVPRLPASRPTPPTCRRPQAEGRASAKLAAAIAAEFFGTLMFALIGAAAPAKKAAVANGLAFAVLIYATANVSGACTPGPAWFNLAWLGVRLSAGACSAAIHSRRASRLPVLTLAPAVQPNARRRAPEPRR